MLHLNFGLNFEALADDLIDRLKAEWTDPFDPPVIIFPDLALEHWFKLKWMSKKSVLANLNTQFLDKFLFNTLSQTSANASTPKSCQRLPGEVMRNMILAWLKMSDTPDIPNWKTLSDEVTHYIQTGDTPDETRIYDFANQMTRLFMDYETSRPGEFKTKEGLVQTWSSQAPIAPNFFKKADPERERWQRKLYQKLFIGDDSILAHVNREIQNLNIQYITLPQLYEACRTASGRITFKGAPSKPVFLFWHAGLGQFYRVALHEYAKTHEVYAYVQNPCQEFWEDVQLNHNKLRFQMPLLQGDSILEDRDESSDNELLAKWGRAGRDNIKLWCESTDYLFDEYYDYHSNIEYNIINDNLALHAIQKCIAQRLDQPEAVIAQDASLNVSAAPSKLRELEHLHTQICHLLQNGANIRDILVVAPDINAYRTAIYQVFGAERTIVEENKQNKRNGEGTSQPALYIPFTIIDGAARESLTARALAVLFRITNRRSLSRLEFFELIRNPLVQNVRGISPDEIGLWENWLTDMNVFRDRDILTDDSKIPYKDWKTGLKRLLLARLTDGRIEDSEAIIRPYADLHSTDNASLCRFVDAVESLEELSQKYTERPDGISLNDLENWFIPYVNSWIAMGNAPRELNAENIIYKSVADSIEMLKFQYVTGLNKITWKCLEQTILDAAESSDYTTGSLFVNGLTFMNFTSNRILPIKHIFFLGMDAASFPGRDITRSLDLRTSEPWPGDNQNAYKNRYAFLCQLMSTSDSMHLSYVNKNLQKDEDFFPSSILNDLFHFCGTSNVTPITLDEDRELRDLFTARSRRNRTIHQCMINNVEDKTKYSDDVPENILYLPERVRLTKIVKYLTDPFQLRVGELLQADDNDIDPEKIVYEPIDVDNIDLLDSIKQVSQIIINKVHNPEDEYSKDNAKNTVQDITNHHEEAQREIQQVLDRYMRNLRESGFRAASLYEKLIKDKILAGAQNVAELMLQANLVVADDDNAIDVILEQEIDKTSTFTKKWLLQGQAETHAWREDILAITSIKLGKSNSCNRFLSAFVSALALVLQKGREIDCLDQCFQVQLHLCGTEASKVEPKYFTLTASESEDILKQIYQYAYIEQYAKAAPMKLLEYKLDKEKDTLVPQISTLDKLTEKLKDEHGPWQFFKKGKIFDLNNDIGYTREGFVQEWREVTERQFGLIKKLNPKGLNIIFPNPE